MRRFHVYTSLAVAVCLAVIPQTASAGGQAADECHRLATNPSDPAKPSNTKGVPFEEINVTEGLAQCQAASKQEPQNARLHYQYGRVLDRAKQGAAALAELTLAARADYAIAEWAIGEMVLTGRPDVLISKPYALGWFERSAKHGCEAGMRSAAIMLEDGDGVEIDIEKAASYWQKLADRGDEEAIASVKSIKRTLAEADAYLRGEAPPKSSGGLTTGEVVVGIAGAVGAGVCAWSDTCRNFVGDAAKEAARQALIDTMRGKPSKP